MAKQNVNRNNQLAVMLLRLKRHLTECDACRAAIKAKSSMLMCPDTIEMILTIAIRWDRNIPGRLYGRHNPGNYAYPCPDTSVHGSAYAVSAELCELRSTVDRLF